MRFKFRAKSLEGNSIVFGDLIHFYGFHYIFNEEVGFPGIRIDSNTISLFVGYTVDGEEIYTGDKLLAKNFMFDAGRLEGRAGLGGFVEYCFTTDNPKNLYYTTLDDDKFEFILEK